MKMQRFVAENNQKAFMKISEVLGEDALIYSTRATDDGVEILAGCPEELDQHELEEPKATVSSSLNENKTTRADKSDYFFNLLSEKIKDMDDKLNNLSLTLNHAMDHEADSEIAEFKNRKNEAIFHLIRLGFPEPFCDQFACKLTQQANTSGRITEKKLGNLILNQIMLDQLQSQNEKHICALIGPTGVGKTTTLLKLAKQYLSQYGCQSLGLISIDHSDSSSRNRLNYYCQAWGVEVLPVCDGHELATAISAMAEKKLILIDTYGVSQRETEQVEKLLLLLEKQDVRLSTLITIPGNIQDVIVDEIIKAFSNTQLTGCILTKQDECMSLAPAITKIIKHKLKLAYICHGQNIDGDIVKVDQSMELNKWITSSRKEKNLLDDHLLKNLLRVKNHIQWKQWDSQLATNTGC